MAEVAARAGVSPSTVSLVLAGKDRDFISSATAENVRKIAEKMGYRQRFSHKLLHGARTNTVAIVLASQNVRFSEFATAVVMRLNELCEAAGLSVYLKTLGPDEKKNIDNVRELINRGCEGFILCGCPVGYLGIEKVFIQNKCDYIGHSCGLRRTIDPDVEGALRLILDRLAPVKLEKIIFFLTLFNGEFRQSVHYSAIKAAFPDSTPGEIDCRIRAFEYPQFSNQSQHILFFNEGYALAARLEGESSLPSAIFCVNGYVALGVLKKLEEQNLDMKVTVATLGLSQLLHMAGKPVLSADFSTDEMAEKLIANLKGNKPLRVSVHAQFLGYRATHSEIKKIK